MSAPVSGLGDGGIELPLGHAVGHPVDVVALLWVRDDCPDGVCLVATSIAPSTSVQQLTLGLPFADGLAERALHASHPETELSDSDARVAANVRAVRLAWRLNLDDLSARLADLGRPIVKSGLSKFEHGRRRVDVGDLLALAVALEVSPTRLLMPPSATAETPVILTDSVAADAVAAWRWATGEAMLPDAVWAPTDSVGERVDSGRWASENRPHHDSPASLDDLLTMTLRWFPLRQPF